MRYKYGNFSDAQIKETAKNMHNEIHKLLLYKDVRISDTIFDNPTDFESYFENILLKYGGLNELLGNPPIMVEFISVLQAVLNEYHKDSFNFHTYRKLILDAHELLREMFGEVRDNA